MEKYTPMSRTGIRITSIDFLRGAAMVVMALDHVRDYLYAGSFYFDPLDLEKTNGILFFTRWITHFCAPIFMMLAGTSAFITGQKKTKSELSFFLLKRGMWLVFLELIVVNFGWNFNVNFPVFLLITIWALGVSMIILAGLIYLPVKMILCLSLLVIAGHNLFDNVHFQGNNLTAFGWALLHEQKPFFWHKELVLVGYPLVPLISIMPLGYCLGQIYIAGFDAAKRRKFLLKIGFGAIILFLLIRYSNGYGDPIRWTVQKNAFFTLMSFLKVNKYPPSLVYVLLTLGVAFLFLGLTEKIQNGFVRFISVYGRVPMFYYLVHIYMIHLIGLLSSLLMKGQDWKMWILEKPIWFSEGLKGYGFSLPVAYLIWAVVVIGLYPICKRYDQYKQMHKQHWWLSYL